MAEVVRGGMSGFEKAVGLYTIVHKEARRIVRIWVQTIVPPAITMALYFIIFGQLRERIGSMSGYDYTQYIAPGLILMSVITNSYGNVVSSFFGAKFQRHLEEMLVSPLPNYIIVLGHAAGGVLRGLVVGLMDDKLVTPAEMVEVLEKECGSKTVRKIPQEKLPHAWQYIRELDRLSRLNRAEGK